MIVQPIHERQAAYIKELRKALEPFVADFERRDDPGVSDLYDEQPWSAHVTLGDVRRARAAHRRLGNAP